MSDKERPSDKDSAARYYKIREDTIWGDKGLVKSGLPNVKIDGLLQMAGDMQQENEGCLPPLFLKWFSAMAKLAGWTDQDIQQSLEHGRQHARLREELGIEEDETIEIRIQGRIKLPSLPFRKKRK